MFDVVRNHKRVVQFFLLLITVPFAIWGLEAYQQGDRVITVAQVGKAAITQAQFQESMQAQQAQIRRQLPPNVDASMLDTPEIRESVLNGLIRQQLLYQEIDRQKLLVDISVLRDMILQIPDFQENGEFSETRYRTVLEQSGMTPESFEAKALKDIQFRFLVGSLSVSAFMPKTVADRLTDLLAERREVQEFILPWQSLKAEVELTDADLRGHYDTHRDQFSVPEQVRVEYVVLENTPENRRASHILLLTEGKSDAEKARIKAEMERILAEARKNPEKFAALAKKHSQDPGSAANGGDLGFNAAGAMVKPFDDALFAMKEGDISNIVETQYGYHIIKLLGIQPGRYGSQSFAQVEEKFSDAVFDNPDSLKPIADEFQLAVQQSGWLTRASALGNGILDHPGFLAAVFDDDVIKNGNNSKAVEVASGVMVAARLLEHKPASVHAFENVKAGIKARLTEERAMALATERGTALLDDVRKGKGSVSWSARQVVSREEPGKLGGPTLKAIFKADVTRKLPVYAGVKLPQVGYALYRINKVTPGEIKDEERKLLARELAAIPARAQISAYVDALRQRYKVTVNPDMLGKTVRE
jgi:peptidyl-prolyl cis-trans isomerase D